MHYLCNIVVLLSGDIAASQWHLYSHSHLSALCYVISHELWNIYHHALPSIGMIEIVFFFCFWGFNERNSYWRADFQWVQTICISWPDEVTANLNKIFTVLNLSIGKPNEHIAYITLRFLLFYFFKYTRNRDVATLVSTGRYSWYSGWPTIKEISGPVDQQWNDKLGHFVHNNRCSCNYFALESDFIEIAINFSCHLIFACHNPDNEIQKSK